MDIRCVLVRTDGKYVARPGSEQSYTSKLEDAQLFRNREEAQRNACVENERVEYLSLLLMRAEWDNS